MASIHKRRNRMKQSHTIAVTLILIILSLLACESESENTEQNETVYNASELDPWLNLPSTSFNYANPNFPNHFLNPAIQNTDNTPSGNNLSNGGATLGRVLFYDKSLSINNTVSCASCHDQSAGFSDSKKLSVGFDGGFTGRNSMGLANATFYGNGKFFWDERANTLEDQTLMPIQDHVEMGMTLDSLEKKLNEKPYYRVLFSNVFSDSIVTSNRISLALSQFVRSMVSYESKYDNAIVQLGRNPRPNENLPTFTVSENLGRKLFFDPQEGGCAGCHSTDAFIAPAALNNGLDATTVDQGVGAVTQNSLDDAKFKVPSLHNIAETAPYMHDGRFANLDDVVEHYNSGVQAHPNLDNRLKLPNSNLPRRLNLTANEKTALVDFLKTLTNNDFLTDEKFSDPFKN